MRIKIESDGTARGTRVVDAATGEMLEHVQAVSWSVRAGPDGPVAMATISLCQVALEAETDALVLASGEADQRTSTEGPADTPTGTDEEPGDTGQAIEDLNRPTP